MGRAGGRARPELVAPPLRGNESRLPAVQPAGPWEQGAVQLRHLPGNQPLCGYLLLFQYFFLSSLLFLFIIYFLFFISLLFILPLAILYSFFYALGARVSGGGAGNGELKGKQCLCVPASVCTWGGNVCADCLHASRIVTHDAPEWSNWRGTMRALSLCGSSCALPPPASQPHGIPHEGMKDKVWRGAPACTEADRYSLRGVGGGGAALQGCRKVKCQLVNHTWPS